MRLFDLVRRRLRFPRRQDDRKALGDFGGSFGYGRPAHKPDPQARYGFKMEQSRVLPVRKESRWR